MTSPQDPSQPVPPDQPIPTDQPDQPDQPGTPAPAEPAPQDWGQQPQTPPWGAPPAGQPGWGAAPGMPPATPPAWGAPTPPPQQPGWGPPQQPGWGPPQGPPPQPGWGPPQGPPGWGPPQGPPGWGPPQGWAPPPSRSNRKGCLIGLGVVLVLLAVLVGGCAITFGPILGTDLKLQSELGSRAESVSFNWNNGQTTFSIYLAPGQDAVDVACHVVKPIIQSSSTPNAHFVIYAHLTTGGPSLPAANETTPCG
jgi:hypothetical protein